MPAPATNEPWMQPTVTGKNLTWLGNLEFDDVFKLDAGWKVSGLVGTSPAVQRAYWYCDDGFGIDYAPENELTESQIKSLGKAPEIGDHFFKVLSPANASKVDTHPELPTNSVVAVECDEKGIEAESPLTIHFNDFGSNAENPVEVVSVLGRVEDTGFKPAQAL